MLILLVGMLFSAIFSTIRTRKLYGEIESSDVFFIAVNTIIACILSLILCIIVGIFLPKVEKTRETPIYAIPDRATLTYLDIESEESGRVAILYMEKTDEGLEPKSISGNNVYIEKGDYEPKKVTTTKEFKHSWYWYLGVNMIITNSDRYITFYIPDGTVDE